jgi:hypothetical protein
LNITFYTFKTKNDGFCGQIEIPSYPQAARPAALLSSVQRCFISASWEIAERPLKDNGGLPAAEEQNANDPARWISEPAGSVAATKGKRKDHERKQ